jgi:hypothetical protein
MTHFRPGKYASYRDYLAYLTEHGEYAGDGRPRISGEDGVDKLLFMLRLVHGEPRYDLYSECAPRPPAVSASAAIVRQSPLARAWSRSPG